MQVADLELLSIDEVAITLRLSRRSVYRLIERGELPAPVRICGRLRFRRAELIQFVQELEPAEAVR